MQVGAELQLPHAAARDAPATSAHSRFSHFCLALACRSVLSDSYRTPLHVMHPPHIVALGALCLAATITQLDLRSWLNGLDADFAAVSCFSGLLRLGCWRVALRSITP